MGTFGADALGLVSAITDASDDSIVVVGLDGTIATWSPGAARVYGYEAHEVLNRSALLLLPEGHRGELTAILHEIQSEGRLAEPRFVGRTKSGKIVELSLVVTPVRDPVGNVFGAAFVARDVTKVAHDQRQRRTMELRWRSIIESAVDGIVVIDSQGHIEAFNPAAERLFGYAEHEVVGRNVSMLMPPPYRDHHDRYLDRYIQEGEARIIGIGRDVQGMRQDGTVFPLHLSVGEMSIDGQRKFTGILHDLSARVQLEEQLRSSEARWRAVIDSAVDGIIVIDGRGRIEAFNPAAERLFGYAEREAVGQNVSILMPVPYRDEHDGYLERYLREGQARIIGAGREVRGRRRDGSTFPLHLSVGEMSVVGQRKFTGILHDLSARVRMEEQLREQEALARLGEMAAVLAHEIRNPLAGIRGAMQIMASRVDSRSGEAGVIKEIIARVDTLTNLMQDLLLFARPPQPKPQLVDLTPLVTTTIDLLREDPAVRGLDVRVEGSAPWVLADAELLKIVFQNLLINGAHAMGGRGELRVIVEAVSAASSVTFADSGPGIPIDIRDKIFAPFFTTKVRGTGLGLPTAKRLVEAQRGTISIDCPSSGGTSVTVVLPLQ
ncbi:MAG TPA: PAS domain S-box protein [Vicinamibacterales bacterium]|jgi:two-component system sensor kinase FixL